MTSKTSIYSMFKKQNNKYYLSMAAHDPGMADPPPAPLSYSTPVISMSSPDNGLVSQDILIRAGCLLRVAYIKRQVPESCAKLLDHSSCRVKRMMDLIPKCYDKRILEHGEGLYKPNERSVVLISLSQRFKSQPNCDTSEVRLTIGDSCTFVEEVIEQCVCTMKEGENCEIEISHDDLQMYDVDGQWTTCKDDLICFIHLKSFTRATDVWRLSLKERVNMAVYYKNNGNALFRQSKTIAAIKQYSKALKMSIPLEFHCKPDEKQDMLVIKGTCLLNLAACYSKLGNFENVCKFCTKALTCGVTDVKVYYRRGIAYLQMNDFELARNDFSKAQEIEPSNKAIAEQLRKLDIKEKEMDKQCAKAYKNMFK